MFKSDKLSLLLNTLLKSIKCSDSLDVTKQEVKPNSERDESFSRGKITLDTYVYVDNISIYNIFITKYTDSFFLDFNSYECVIKINSINSSLTINGYKYKNKLKMIFNHINDFDINKEKNNEIEKNNIEIEALSKMTNIINSTVSKSSKRDDIINDILT